MKKLDPKRENSASDGAFRLSRIYAEGWNTAKKTPLPENGHFDPVHLLAMSPYKVDPQRSRWIEGFTKSIGQLAD